jgi:hypothetical protein
VSLSSVHKNQTKNCSRLDPCPSNPFLALHIHSIICVVEFVCLFVQPLLVPCVFVVFLPNLNRCRRFYLLPKKTSRDTIPSRLDFLAAWPAVPRHHGTLLQLPYLSWLQKKRKLSKEKKVDSPKKVKKEKKGSPKGNAPTLTASRPPFCFTFFPF